MLIRLAANQGQSQQAIAEMIGVNATRMVFLVDELEKLAWSSAGATRPTAAPTRCT